MDIEASSKCCEWECEKSICQAYENSKQHVDKLELRRRQQDFYDEENCTEIVHHLIVKPELTLVMFLIDVVFR